MSEAHYEHALSPSGQPGIIRGISIDAERCSLFSLDQSDPADLTDLTDTNWGNPTAILARATLQPQAFRWFENFFVPVLAHCIQSGKTQNCVGPWGH